MVGGVVGQKMSRAGGLDSGGTGGASYALEDALDEPFIESDANSDGEPASVLLLPVWEMFGKSNIEPKLIKSGLPDQYHTTPAKIKNTRSTGRARGGLASRRVVAS